VVIQVATMVLGLLLHLFAMRDEHSHAEASTIRRTAKPEPRGWGVAPEAPTHLPVDQPIDRDDDEPATHAARATGSQPRPRW
jgi:hypothetical protein